MCPAIRSRFPIGVTKKTYVSPCMVFSSFAVSSLFSGTLLSLCRTLYFSPTHLLSNTLLSTLNSLSLPRTIANQPTGQPTHAHNQALELRHPTKRTYFFCVDEAGTRGAEQLKDWLVAFDETAHEVLPELKQLYEHDLTFQVRADLDLASAKLDQLY
jgi:hypothetical protein